MEGKAELLIDNGEIVEIRYSSVKGRRSLDPHRARDFKAVVEKHAQEIVDKWVDYFVYHKPVPPQRITRRIR